MPFFNGTAIASSVSFKKGSDLLCFGGNVRLRGALFIGKRCVGVFAGSFCGPFDVRSCFFVAGKEKMAILIPFGLYFGVCAAVGGVMSAVSTLFSRLEYVPESNSGSSVSFFALALAGGLATFLWGRLCQRRAKNKCVQLHLEYGGKALDVEAFVDTANHLCDPLGGRPVVVIDRMVARELLPSMLLDAAERGMAGLSLLPPTLARRVRMIPAATVTGRGILLAIAPDKATLDAGRGAHAVELLLSPAPLGSAVQGHKALLPPTLLTE